MRGTIHLAFSIFSVFTLIFTACDNQNDDISSISSNVENAQTYFSSSNIVELEVVYEPNAAPFTGAFGQSNIWDITQANIEEVFADRPLSVFVSVPKTLSEMTQVPSQNRRVWTIQDLLTFTENYRQRRSSMTQSYFFVAFVNGIFVNQGIEQPSTIGVNITGTPICFIFKDVVNSGISNGTTLTRFLEQSTLVHELGHAFGYVNSGIPLTSDHWDEEHGAHCTNENCVMFWLNEGVRNLSQFVEQYLQSGDLILYGPECIQDAREYLP